jgi:hypothetical protein
MPSVLRKCGAEFVPRGATEKIQPYALVSFCEGCNFEGAPFGETIDGKLLSYCGWKDGQPICVNRNEATK